jgi:drug/metabolite transporter (DMT)-like permease
MKVPRSAVAFLAIGLLAASQSGNIIRIGDAHPAAIAAWRLLLATGILFPLAAPRLSRLADLDGRGRAGLVLGGVALALHFITWIAAVQFTTVANAAIFFSVNPVLTALGGRIFYGERGSPRLALSIGLGLAGVVVMGASDVRLAPGNLVGDAFALGCSVLFSAYMLLGKRVRQTLDNRVYVTALYGVAAVTAFAALAVLDVPATGYTPRTWLCFALMALVPTLLGHTSFNYALRWVEAGRISVLTLVEPALAGLVAWGVWGEEPGLATLAGYALVCLSVLVLITERRVPEPPVEP